jgi:hypothetical protein
LPLRCGLNDGSRDTSGKPLVSLFSLHNLPQGIVGFDCFFGGGRFASLAVEQQVFFAITMGVKVSVTRCALVE